MIKIDAFSHILTMEYLNRFTLLAPEIRQKAEWLRPSMKDYDTRENLMRRHPDVLQIITMGNIPLERYVSAKDAVELAKIGNDELAELVARKPGLFYGAAGVLPMNDIGASLDMVDYCIRDLRLLGVQMFATVEGVSLAEPKFRPIFAKMAEYDRPVWIHPCGTDPDRGMFSWPYESSYCMYELVKTGIFEELPNLKIIVHHAGAMVPFFRERISTIMGKRAEGHFKKFYVDTALYGNTSGLMNAYDYFGAEHMLLGTDAPMGAPHGSNGNTESTIMAVERMSISGEEKEKILRGNAIDLFGIFL